MTVTIKIIPDSEAESPRDWEHLGTMVCFHKRYGLGDKHTLSIDNFRDWEGVEQYLVEACDAVLVLPLYLYDHSGVRISTTPFSDRWDSGQVGFIYVTKVAVRKEFGPMPVLIERVANVLRGEVETYDQYLSGDVWGYILGDETDDHLDSCWGFYGRESAEEAAKVAAATFSSCHGDKHGGNYQISGSGSSDDGSAVQDTGADARDSV